jgi:hypothetical protein
LNHLQGRCRSRALGVPKPQFPCSADIGLKLFLACPHPRRVVTLRNSNALVTEQH